jgi:hypothetical protein
MRSIEEIHDGRDVIMGKDVIECIKVKTGRSISANTLIAWRAMDVPGAFQPPGQRYWFYAWEPLWAWYQTYTATKASKRRKKSDKDL